MACTCRTSPMPIEASPKGGSPDHGHKPRIGIAAPVAVVQPQGSQLHTEALARTAEWRFRAHAPRCLMCTPRSAPTLADPRSKSASKEPSRASCREAVDQRSGSRGSVEVVQLERSSLRQACRSPYSLSTRSSLARDGLLDSGDLTAGPHCLVPERRRGRMLWMSWSSSRGSSQAVRATPRPSG